MVKQVTTTLFVFFIAASIKAQDMGELTFSEAVKIALENNVNIKRQENQQYVNRARKTASMVGIGPSVDAFAQAWRVQGNQFIEQEARVVNDAQTSNFYGTIDARMTLFNGFNRINTIKQSTLDLEAQQYLVKRTKQDVIADVANQYLQCLLDIELLRIAEEDLETQNVQLQQISAMVEEGSRPKIDQYNQESVVKTAEVTVLRAKIRLRNDKATLSQTLQLDPSLQYEVSQPDWGTTTVGMDDAQLSSLYETALSTRGDYLRAVKNEESTQKGMSISRALFVPNVQAFGSVNSRYSDASIPSFGTQFGDNQRNEFGVRMSIPIFSAFRNRTTFVQSKVDHENAKLTRNNLENTVKIDVLNAYQNYQDAEVNFEATQAQYEAAELAFRLESERYDLEASDLVQYSTASQRFVQARGDLAQAKFTLLFQDILLRYATGTLQIDDLPE